VGWLKVGLEVFLKEKSRAPTSVVPNTGKAFAATIFKPVFTALSLTDWALEYILTCWNVVFYNSLAHALY
jgi:hypothetical protein